MPVQNQYYPQQSKQKQPEEPKHPLHFLDTKIIFPLVVILVLMFFGFGVYSYFKSGAETASENVQPGASQTMPAESTSPLNAAPAAPVMLDAYARADACSAAQDITETDNCLSQTAIETAKPSICDQIKTPEIRADCLTAIAVEYIKPDFCFDIEILTGEHSSDRCIYELAKKTGRESMCGLIVGEAVYTQEDCIQAVVQAQ